MTSYLTESEMVETTKSIDSTSTIDIGVDLSAILRGEASSPPALQKMDYHGFYQQNPNAYPSHFHSVKHIYARIVAIKEDQILMDCMEDWNTQQISERAFARSFVEGGLGADLELGRYVTIKTHHGLGAIMFSIRDGEKVIPSAFRDVFENFEPTFESDGWDNPL